MFIVLNVRNFFFFKGQGPYSRYYILPATKLALNPRLAVDHGTVQLVRNTIIISSVSLVNVSVGNV